MEKTEFEKEFGLDLSSAGSDIMKALDVAIRAEEAGKSFYTRNAAKLVNQNIRPFLEFLSREENRHVRMLSEVRKSLSESGKWMRPPESGRELRGMLLELRAFQGRDANKEIRNSGDLSIISTAMETEKRFMDFYMKVAGKTEDEQGRTFLKALAEWENNHLRLLQGIQEAADDFRMES